MTIYTGDITKALTFLQTSVDAVATLDRANSLERATIKTAAAALIAKIDGAIVLLDKQIGSNAAGGLATIVSGVFAPDAAVTLPAQTLSLEQMAGLMAMRGYAGRVQLNFTLAG